MTVGPECQLQRWRFYGTDSKKYLFSSIISFWTVFVFIVLYTVCNSSGLAVLYLGHSK